mmetsp:Transcript_7500/g.18941  ORF Transcript_7500/g.18941 Transcript_7500/m.18941 type:complete len:229 (-) Transcript_7500:43-729(-)
MGVHLAFRVESGHLAISTKHIEQSVVSVAIRYDMRKGYYNTKFAAFRWQRTRRHTHGRHLEKRLVLALAFLPSLNHTLLQRSEDLWVCIFAADRYTGDLLEVSCGICHITTFSIDQHKAVRAPMQAASKPWVHLYDCDDFLSHLPRSLLNITREECDCGNCWNTRHHRVRLIGQQQHCFLTGFSLYLAALCMFPPPTPLIPQCGGSTNSSNCGDRVLLPAHFPSSRST